jgi:isoamylase
LNRFFDGTPAPRRGLPDIAWHGVPQDGSPWHDPQARLLRFTLAALAPGEEDLHVVLNMSERAVDVPLPWVPGRQWHMAVDTAIASPFDVRLASRSGPQRLSFHTSMPRSVTVLEAP